ncbi:hypothetical protein GC167_03580 [bacterium]|nr:hypothetical protein [bacterium]
MDAVGRWAIALGWWLATVLSVSAQGRPAPRVYRIASLVPGASPQFLTDSLGWETEREALEAALDQQGYWLRRTERSLRSDTVTYRIAPGPLMRRSVRDSTGASVVDWAQTWTEWDARGFPFAQFEPQSIGFQGEAVEISGRWDPGPAVALDSLVQKGTYRIPRGWLKHYFDLRLGQPLPYDRIKTLEQDALKSGLCAFTQPPAVLYGEQKTTLYLYPSKLPSNRLDALLGLSTQADGRTVVTGRFDLKWVDLFRSGEQIRIFWEALPEQSQQLDLRLSLPYVWATPVRLNASFQFLRQDSSFATFKTDAGIDYLLNRSAWLGAVLLLERSRVPLETSDFSDYSKELLGIEVGIDERDARFGLYPEAYFRLKALAGSRRRTGTVESQYRLELELEKQRVFRKRNAGFAALKAGSMPGAVPAPNERFRLGGPGSLRGIPPLSVFAAHFALGTLEYRRQLDRQTLFAILADGMVSDERPGALSIRGGLGLGLSLALGKAELAVEAWVPGTDTQGFDVRLTALHIRFETLF